MGSYLHEWAGLQGGFKQAAIFYVTHAELEEHKWFFEYEGFHAISSDFAYNYSPVGVEKTKTNIKSDSRYSLYVSSVKETAQSLKEFDYHHQLQIPHPEKNPQDIFFEISALLGYPRCCSQFLQNVHDRPAFKTQVACLGNHYSDETLYPMLALQQNKNVDWKLNNFSEHIPRLISFLSAAISASMRS